MCSSKGEEKRLEMSIVFMDNQSSCNHIVQALFLHGEPYLDIVDKQDFLEYEFTEIPAGMKTTLWIEKRKHPLEQAVSHRHQIATRRSVSAHRILPASGVGSSRHDPFPGLA